MYADHWYDFLRIAGVLALVIVLAVWLIGLSVDRDRRERDRA